MVADLPLGWTARLRARSARGAIEKSAPARPLLFRRRLRERLPRVRSSPDTDANCSPRSPPHAADGTVDIGEDVNEKLKFGDMQRPRFYYIAGVNCESGAGLDFGYTITSLNPGGAWMKQFGVDEQGLLATYLVFFLAFVVGSALHIWGLIKMWRQDALHPIVKLLTSSILLQCVSIFCEFVHLAIYSGNGVGAPVMDGISQVLDMVSQLFFMLLLILISKGWTISSPRLTDRRALFIILAVFLFSYVALFIWKEAATDSASTSYVYESPPGIILLVMRTLTLGWFLYCLHLTFTHETHPDKRRFYIVFGSLYSLWFIGLPVIVGVAAVLDAWVRMKIVMAIYLAVNMAAVSGLGWLLWPSRAHEYFRITAPDLLAGGSGSHDHLQAQLIGSRGVRFIDAIASMVARICVVGAGYWGPNLARNVAQSSKCELTHVCDIDKPLAAALAEKYGAMATSQLAEDVLANDAVDAIAIATPARTHYPLAKQALLAGKHVIVEKPLTETVAQAEELVALAKDLGLVLMMDHTFCYCAPVQFIREKLDESSEESLGMGRVLYIDSVRINLGLFRSDVDVIWDLAPHDLSIIDFILPKSVGEPLAVSTMASDPTATGQASIAHLFVHYANDVTVHIHVSWLSPMKKRQFIIGGERKMIVWDDMQNDDKIRIFDKGIDVDPLARNSTLPTYRHGDCLIPVLPTAEPLAAVIADFADCIADPSREPLTSGESGLRVQRILAAAQLSAGRQGQRVSLRETASPVAGTNVPFLDLRSAYLEIKSEVDDAISQVLTSANYIGGPQIAAFECEFAAYVNVAHAVGVSNGTDGLVLALKTLGIGEGDEVITQANTFYATTYAIAAVGAVSVLVDVHEDTMMMNMDQLAGAITERTRAIIPVHLYGQAADMDALQAAVAASGRSAAIKVLEDASQAHGCEWNGQPVGGFGDMAVFSLYPGKNLGAYGDAGIVVTNSDEYAARLVERRNLGRTDHHGHRWLSGNHRLDTVQAAVLQVRLRHLDAWNSRRRDAAARYHAGLSGLAEAGHVRLPGTPGKCLPVFHLFPIRVASNQVRDALRAYLSEQDISTGIHYPVPIHRTEAMAGYLLANQDLTGDASAKDDPFPVASSASECMISLPIHPHLTRSAQRKVIGAVAAFFAQ